MFTGNPPPAIIGRAAASTSDSLSGISSSPQVRNAGPSTGVFFWPFGETAQISVVCRQSIVTATRSFASCVQVFNVGSLSLPVSPQTTKAGVVKG